jgi:hypothetical protein
MDLDHAVTDADKAAFMTKWQAKDLDADFRGVGAGVRPPDGRIMLGDMDGFTSVFLAARASGRSLAALPAGHPLAGEITPLPLLGSATGGVDILAEAAGKIPPSPILPISHLGGLAAASTSTPATTSSDSDLLKVRQAYATDDGAGAVLRI